MRLVPSIRWVITTSAVSAVLALPAFGCGSKTPQEPSLSVTNVSVNPASVQGGTGVQGSVTLSGNAPAGGTAVSLTSSNAAAAVPGSVTVNGGQSSATFAITTASVSTDQTSTITASLNGSSRTATLTVSAIPLPTASFTVSGPQGNNRCKFVATNFTLDCTFDATASTGNPTTYLWTYTIGPNTLNPTSNPPTANASRIQNPGTTLNGNTCGLFNGQTGATQLNMVVRLTVRSAIGTSTEAVNNAVTVLPADNRTCF